MLFKSRLFSLGGLEHRYTYQMASFRLPFSLLKTLPNARNVSNFKSSISLSNLYPKSSLSFSPVKIPESESFSGYIPINKLEVTYSRSSGPGGQNVNVVSTKVDLRFHVNSADWLSDEVKKCIIEKLKNKINKDGYLIVKSDKTRSQIYNQADAITKLRTLIWSSIAPKATISEETLQTLRKKKEKANQERLLLKRMHSAKKQERQDAFVL